jgi:hypothetical protein
MKSNILCPKDLEVIFLQRFSSRHNYPQVTPLRHILFFYYTCNEILILKVDTMENFKTKTLFIVSPNTKGEVAFLVNDSDISEFMSFVRQSTLNTFTVVARSVFEYDSIVAKEQLSVINSNSKLN